MMKKQNFALVLLCGLMATTAVVSKASADTVKIAFVDMRRALNETNEGKRAMKKLQKEKDKLQKKIEAKEKQIVSMQEAIKKQQAVLSEKKLQEKMEDYSRSMQELQQTYYQFQQELAQKEMKETQSILAKMEKILQQIGRSESYTMIYDRSSGAVVWAPSHLDLTDKLIQAYNKKYK